MFVTGWKKVTFVHTCRSTKHYGDNTSNSLIAHIIFHHIFSYTKYAYLVHTQTTKVNSIVVIFGQILSKSAHKVHTLLEKWVLYMQSPVWRFSHCLLPFNNSSAVAGRLRRLLRTVGTLGTCERVAAE